MVGSSCAVQVLSTTEDDGQKKSREVLQSLFTGLMSTSKTVISDIISKMISRLNFESEVCKSYNTIFYCSLVCCFVLQIASKHVR